jgi:hypothetical protein
LAESPVFIRASLAAGDPLAIAAVTMILQRR